jgi:hypothetical protein
VIDFVRLLKGRDFLADLINKQTFFDACFELPIVATSVVRRNKFEDNN